MDNVVQFNKIAAYFQRINTALSRRPLQATAVTEQIAWVMSGLNAKMGREISFAGGGVGREIIFPLPMFGSGPLPSMVRRRSHCHMSPTGTIQGVIGMAVGLVTANV